VTWNEVRKWAKDQGYSVTKNNGYSWFKLDKPERCGTTTSVSKLAFAIYNDLTDNKWLDYQLAYKEKNEPPKF
jgi:hypothetical protein